MRARDDDRRESPPIADSVESHSLRAAVGLFLIVSPVILMVGTIRWNIPGKLDADLAVIAYWFCDVVLAYLILLPLSRATKNPHIQVLHDKSLRRVGLLLALFRGLGLLTFIVATICAFHYLISQLFIVLGHR